MSNNIKIYNNSPFQPDNPDDQTRYALLRHALAENGRIQDFDFIIKEMSPPPDILNIAKPGSFKGIKIGIIGAGLSGLSSAFELRKLGFDSTRREAASERIGGRVYTYYFDKQKTLYGEFGPMRMPVSHETLWHYINLFRLNTRPFIQTNKNGLIYLRKVRVKNDPLGLNVKKYIYPKYNLYKWERQLSWKQLGYCGFESHLLSANPINRSEILQVKPYYNPYIINWDSQSNRDILQNTGLSQDGINLLQNFYALAGQNMYNSYLDYAQEIYSVDLSYLYEISGGLAKLPLSFYESFKWDKLSDYYPNIPVQCLGNVKLKMGAVVTGIYKYGDKNKIIITYTDSKNSNKLREEFDYIICAIPFSVLRTIQIDPLFSYSKMQCIKEVNYINSQKTLMAFNRRFWEEGGPDRRISGGASYTDLPITQVYYPSDHSKYYKAETSNTNSNSLSIPLKYTKSTFPYLEPGVLLASYNFNLEATRLGGMPYMQRLNLVRQNLEELHGLPEGYLEPFIIGFKTVNWNDEPYFRGALCFYTPEQKKLFSYASSLPEYDGRVFFAGEHISAKHRWMQGALQSGMKAANSLALECLKNSLI